MKKIFAIALIIGLLFIGSAESTQLSKTYISENNAAGNLTTAVSTSTIIPGIHKIVSYSVLSNLNSGVGAWVTLYSGTTALKASIIGESEALANSTDGEVWGYPKAVKGGGLTLVQSCYSTVLIEYTR